MVYLRRGMQENYDRFKPEGFEHYLTMAELCNLVGRNRRRVTTLESLGKIPAPIRVKVGRLQVRLYSPDDVRKIKAYFKNAKPGRPTKGDAKT